MYKRWLGRYGECEAEKRLKQNKIRRAAAMSNRNMGRTLSKETRSRIASSCTGIPNILKGKTFVEFYGKDRARELAEEHSRKLKEGYRSGRLKPTARSKSAPVFRGTRLRSKLERDAILFLETRDDLTFGRTLIYEPAWIRPTWVDDRGIEHVYIPDLFDSVRQRVYEVKPQWQIDSPSDSVIRKAEAVIALGYHFQFITDVSMSLPNT